MKQLSRLYCWWPGIDEMIDRRIGECDSCQENRISIPKSEVLRWPDAQGPWVRVHLDFAPKFMNRSLLIAVCSWSKWIEVGVTRCDMMSTARTIEMLQVWFTRFGFPAEIVSDNGTQFSSNEFKTFCALNGIKLKFSAPGKPATNGEAERYVQYIKNGLKKLLKSPSNLQKGIEELLFRYRCTPNSSTGHSPARMFLGREIRSQMSLMVGRHRRGGGGDGGSDFPESDLKIGTPVRFKSFAVRGPKWLKGEIVEVEGPRHYKVKDQDGNVSRRHRDQVFRSRVSA